MKQDKACPLEKLHSSCEFKEMRVKAKVLRQKRVLPLCRDAVDGETQGERGGSGEWVEPDRAHIQV